MKRRSAQKSSVNPLELPSKRTRAPATADSESSWSETGQLMYCNFSSTPSSKILGFDMDSTLIATKSGRTFPTNDQDWRILYTEIPSKLQSMQAEGYRILIFTNQKGIQQGHQDKKGMQNKIKAILTELNINALVMVSCGDDEFRKPCTGMWDYFIKNLNGGIQVDLQESKYVGDAAGRPKTGKRKEDFNDTDLKYALNIGIPFETPEKFFLGEVDNYPLPEVNPKNIKKNGSVFKGQSDNEGLASNSIEVIIFVGSPGSGKSTFWKNYLSAYTRVNNDTLKTKEKCLKVMRQSLESRKSCVIDNTNPTAQVRSEYLKVAKEFNVPVRCFIFSIPKGMAFHLDTLRKINAHRKHLSKRVGSIPIHKFFKDFEKPELSEGFTEIKEVELVGGPFDNPIDESLFYSFVYA